MTASLPRSIGQVVDATTIADSHVPILVVNDNAAQRLAMRSVLAPLGYEIVEADSGLEALRRVMQQSFAVILLDVCMPDMDGFETAALIRLRKQSEMTPLIFITAYGSDELPGSDLYTQGAVDFIFAPVPPDELRAKVAAFANLFVRANELAARAVELQTSADEFWLLTDAAPIGIFQTDAEHRFVYTNPRWSEITGIALDDASGQTWETFLGSDAHSGPIAERPSADVDQPELTRRYEIPVAGASSRIVLVTSKPIADADGKVVGWVGTLADISAEAGAEAAMSDARDKATEASRLKSDFLANMSHEIRTPMNGVLGMTDLLLETDLDTHQRDYVQTVRNSGEALLTIINDILDFSKVEAGKLEIEEIDFDVRSIVNDVVDLLAGPAQTKGLELITAIERAVHTVVRGDPGRVRQVLTNLIGNAIKFTQTGEIVVRVTNADATTVRFEVSDTGDGIAADKLGDVFQPFVQADTSTSRRYGGTGLGLAISSQLVALMGGDCGVDSRLGEGSRFWFTVAVHSDTEQPDNDALARDPDLVGVTALVVDDNATVRTVLSDHLTNWGMTATTADSGEAALTVLRTAAAEGSPIAVALIDLSMPGMDGLALKSAIVADPDLTTRLLLMTGLGQGRDLGPVANSGISATLSKPVHLIDLHAGLRVALRLQAAEPDPRRDDSTGAPEPDVHRAGRLLLAEDNLINQKVAAAMLSSAGYTVDTVPNGLEAVRAATNHHYDAILMDCQMPEMNGYEATAAIRAHEASDRHTPIIAMTASARREDRQRCLAAGMDSYLAKPVSKDRLLSLVLRSVTVVAPRPGNAPASPPLTRIPRPSGEMSLDLTIFDELCLLGETADEDLVGDATDEFVRHTPPMLVALREAFAHDDAFGVGRIAHSIKGGAGALGGRRLAASCDRLETLADTGSLSEGGDDVDAIEDDYQQLRGDLAERRSAMTGSARP